MAEPNRNPLSDAQVTQIMANLERSRPGSLVAVQRQLEELVQAQMVALLLERNPDAPLLLQHTLNLVDATLRILAVAKAHSIGMPAVKR